jgi:hypothetical protein
MPKASNRIPNTTAYAPIKPDDSKRTGNRVVKQRRTEQYRDYPTQRQKPFAANMFPHLNRSNNLKAAGHNRPWQKMRADSLAELVRMAEKQKNVLLHCQLEFAK